ncbi:NmrA family NAD(P)-binding protein [Chelativorans alearense]|uniref:NmrA family NAD(P)-binding protein n=1 Tax=Chelativorans alearense TaxID=2681495 RepID=UPI0013D87D93|nr:NmrA family NAD(P)-binding protein [Chelativorans alearense]
MSDTLFVTGASGQLGRAIINSLLGAQKVAPSRIVAGTRNPGKLADLAAKGINVAKADFDDPSGLEKSFAGSGTVLIVSTDAMDAPGKRLRRHQAAIAAAAKAGAKRIAYTSLPKAENSAISFAPDHLGSEQAVKATGLPYLIFRNSWYAENLFMSLPQALKSGQWYTSAGEGRIAYVPRADQAAAIAGALANPPTTSTTYTLTGTEALSNAEIAVLASEITGKPIQVVNLTDEQLAGSMKAAGMPEPAIPMILSFNVAARAGDLATVTSDVERLSGRKPLSVRDWLTANRAAFAG